MLATYRQKEQVKPIFGNLPQELYREIYDFDDTYHNVFGEPMFLTEIQNMKLQINFPIQYHFIKILINNINAKHHKECVKMYRMNGTPIYKQRLVPLEYKIEIFESTLIPNFCNYHILPINHMASDYEHTPWYGCICDPTKLVKPDLRMQYYLKMDNIKVPEISDTLVLYYDSIL